MKVRQNGRIVSVAVIVAVAVNSDGRREVLGMAIGASEAETFWVDFLRSLARRGLRGVKLVISDAHEGLKAAVAKVLHASWQRCRVGPLKKRLLMMNLATRWHAIQQLKMVMFASRQPCGARCSAAGTAATGATGQGTRQPAA